VGLKIPKSAHLGFTDFMQTDCNKRDNSLLWFMNNKNWTERPPWCTHYGIKF
jgi:hypothetical protein